MIFGHDSFLGQRQPLNRKPLDVANFAFGPAKRIQALETLEWNRQNRAADLGLKIVSVGMPGMGYSRMV
jgi:hypothetical protein